MMDYTTLLPESQEGQEQPAKEMQSLYEVCQQVVDGRKARGKRYDVAGLLVVLVLAKLAGMQSLLGPVTGRGIRKRGFARGCSCRGHACRSLIPTAMRWHVWTVNRSMRPWQPGSCERRPKAAVERNPAA